MTSPTHSPPPAPDPVSPPAEGRSDLSVPESTRGEATAVGRVTADAGRQVADAAADQAAQVGQEARRQAKDLYSQVRDQAVEQARTGQQRAGESLQALAAELQEMAGGGSGPAADLAAQAAERLEGASRWLGDREPGDLLDEFRGLARRRPGSFLIGAAAAGLLVGRLTRGAIDANRDAAPPAPPIPTTVPSGTPPTSAPSGGPPPISPSPADPGTQWTDPGRTPAHAPRPGATTVGEYVDELEHRGTQPYPGDPR
ncbi:hypothetical protein GCM10009836_72560 [Pseudonocardia ailaonensis]|uniref:DUF3618 domain-containing protein n=1 Tax=Pseudonocardia ailaonensis TaxID=367279 RepID=A0ABN2NPL2_9PSEU